MTLQHYSIEKLKQELSEIIQRHYSPSKFKLFFFGSRVRNPDMDDRADIDVGFEGESQLPILVLGRIKADIDNIRTLYKIDFVDFRRSSKLFTEEASRYIEQIYP